MDVLSIIGLLMGFAAIIGGNALEGGHIDSLVQPTAFLIVAGGTVGAVLLQTPVPIFFRSLKMTMWVFMPPRTAVTEVINRVVEWSNIARKEGLLGLEALTDSEPDGFSRKGLQLLVDGTEPDVIRGILEVELDVKNHNDMQAAKVYEGLGGYSPTIGIIGAVMGLIHVMENLSDPSKLGTGIAVAFVATIYGVGLANLVFLPVANKLKSISHRQLQAREMIVEGIVAISQGENPHNIENKLTGYVD